jgi:hypothetical protein
VARANRTLSPGVVVAIVAAVALVGWEATHQQPAPKPTKGPGSAAAPTPVTPPLPADFRGNGEITLKRDDVLVTVNGVVLTAKDVIGFGPDQADRSLGRPDLRTALDLAVTRVLLTQEATVQGLTMSDAERVWVGRPLTLKMALGAAPATKPGSDAATVEIDKRNADANILLGGLLAKAGTPVPGMTSDEVLAYFREHAQEFGSVDPSPGTPEWDRVDSEIKTRNVPAQLARFNTQRAVLVNELKAKAQISY